MLGCAVAVRADTFGSKANTFDIEFVTIGNPGNVSNTAGSPIPVGSVPYTYRIGKYEISEAIIDKANATGELGINHGNQGINRPVTWVSWFDAAKFVNWLNTSTGNAPAYKFINDAFALWQPGDAGYDATNLFRNTQARYFLPTDDEWYKAAFYDPTRNIYDYYPTGSNAPPTWVAHSTAPITAVYDQGEEADISQAGGLSSYGTMAQGGNAKEWVETEFDRVNSSVFALRIARGGDADDAIEKLESTAQGDPHYPGQQLFDTGFRVASTASAGEASRSTGVPEPASVILLLLATAMLSCFRGLASRRGSFLLVICATFLVASVASATITIDTVPVDNAGNPIDPADGDSYTPGIQNFGGVSYAYRIGTYEVTVGQYTAFLNAVAVTDTYGLYNPSMATDVEIAGIARNGLSGSYTYSMIGSPNHPVTYVSWGDAARFCNWLHNGQPAGGEVAGTTEDGAIALNGAVTDTALNAVTRDAGAKWFIPTENEWYKAAYHKNDGPTNHYWSYPTRSNSLPNSDQPPGDPSIQTNVGNFYRDDWTGGNYNIGLAATGNYSAFNDQNLLTDVGAYSFASSPYGTFDQGGNVLEWNEAIIDDTFRGLRGGSWSLQSYYLNSSIRDVFYNPTDEGSGIGFRVATVPPIVGDYNGDGVVDAADYVVWRKDVPRPYTQSDYDVWRSHVGEMAGTASPVIGDYNGDGVVDGADYVVWRKGASYDVWRSHFGQTASIESAIAATSAVPEPTSMVILFFAGMTFTKLRRRETV